jgi:predicted ester cyclase
METNNKSAVRKLYASLMAEGDTKKAFTILSENYIDHDIPGFNGTGSREDLKNAVMVVRAAFPDIKPTLCEMVEENNWVCVRVEAGGHHTGKAFMGIPSTGKAIRWKEIHLFRCDNNIIVEHRGVFDLMGIMHQLSVTKYTSDKQ